MFVIMLIKLYTTRILLQVLGTDDFGIWNVIYGAVIAFSFISTPIITATQRYLNYDQGKGGANQSKIFTTSLVLTSAAAMLLIIFLESIGLNFFKIRLEIPTDSELSALIVYHCCTGILAVNLIRVPYESIIISHEKFSFYALASFIEAGFLLAMILILKFVDVGNPLILYGICSLALAIALLLGYVIFCRFKFRNIRFEKKLDNKLVKDIGKFSFWNLFGAISSVLSNQGVNVLFNMFCGVEVNAAYGISMQVTGAFILMIGNLIKAANPRIVKTYAMEDNEEMMNITTNISKFSFLLIFCVSFIVMNFIDLILSLWLGPNIPKYTNIFCIFSIIYILIVCISSPVDTVIFATGEIKKYQIVISGVILLNFLFAYILLKKGLSPISVLIFKCFVEILVLAVRAIFVKIKINYSIKNYIVKIIWPSLLLVFFSCLFMELIKIVFHYNQKFEDMMLFSTIYIPMIGFICWYLYISPVRRIFIKNKFKSFLSRIIKKQE